MNTEILLKYIDGNATDQEKISITNWLDSDPDHMKEFLALRKLNDISIWQSPAAGKAEQKPKKENSGSKLKPLYFEFLKIAAIIVVAVLVSRLLFPETQPSNPVVMQTIHVPAGQQIGRAHV